MGATERASQLLSAMQWLGQGNQVGRRLLPIGDLRRAVIVSVHHHTPPYTTIQEHTFLGSASRHQRKRNEERGTVNTI